ncbi:UDP-galactose phosphate transferase [Sphingobium sp. SCG-1]|uniref:sugar transferase n=1 Tax=Sphingobium sp. SCG-1 TaxID=2072936 RepID=UPI000CD6BBE7|nr:sugar transferase [Sphingobium sp. SCG-1]AUW57378.1 UDP-galactose phosphate transferase [Sphingobium sp. SCG-1]
MSIRRVVDVTVASAAILATLPVTMAIGATIALRDGRPVLFRQKRVSAGGRLFHVVKFRTMRDGRDAAGQLLPDAVRMTKLGRLLRATRLDELPQLWNILSGSMSLIGPRPLLPETIMQAGDKGWLRCAIRPGLTGWAQVNGNALLSDADKIALDLWYIANRSLSLDLRILGRTLLVAARGERPNDLSIRRAHEGDPHWRS